jgi:hypothetical protein
MFKSNIFSIILILILLALNTYVSIQYVSVNKELKELKNPNATGQVSASVVLTEVLDVVLNTRPTTPDDRIKLESDIRQLGDKDITAQWEKLVASKDAKATQTILLKLIGMLEDKMEAVH